MEITTRTTVILNFVFSRPVLTGYKLQIILYVRTCEMYYYIRKGWGHPWQLRESNGWSLKSWREKKLQNLNLSNIGVYYITKLLKVCSK